VTNAPSAAPLLDEQTVFRSLFTAYPDALLLVDGGGRIVLANPAAAELLGYTRDELLGLAVDALVPDSIRPRHAAYREAYARSPRTRPMGSTQTELVARKRDGSQVQVEISLSPLPGHGGPLVVAAIRGIADYPRVKQALLRARYAEQVAQIGRIAVDARHPDTLLEQVPRIAAEVFQADTAVVFLTEPNGVELRIAGGVGLPPDEPLGQRLVLPAGSPGAHVLATNEPVTIDDAQQQTRFVLPQRSLAQGLRSALLVPITDRGRTIGVLALRSREPRHFGADELRTLESMASLLGTTLQRAHSEEALQHAQRLESVGQLTGGIAHDFNNLLTVIQGNLQMLDELPELRDGMARDSLAAAARASRRGAELTGKLLAFSRRQVLQPARVDMHAMLDSLAGMLRRTLDQRIRIAVDVQPGCPPLRADPGQLESALLNIAINARDAMPDGGLLSFAAAPDADMVAIAVADTGGGMSDEVCERAFEPFFTTKEHGRGTGLGLSTVYGFAKQSNGAVEIDSAPGRGTTVTLRIPRWRDAADDTHADDLPAVPLPPGLRVLLVEDDAEVRRVVRGFLGALGCTVAEAADAEQALALLDATAPVDVLLTDIALGAGLRGTELARLAQARRRGLPVLLMSGFASEMLEPEPGEPLPWELLRKPYSREQLARALARALTQAQAAGARLR
jgi:PAS domain S-box-containing protein